MRALILTSVLLALPMTAAATPPIIPEPPPLPPEQVWPGPSHPENPLGHVWEEQEVSGWRGTWVRRGASRIFDGYWTHPGGERVLATLEVILERDRVIVVRRHRGGRYCRYDGVLTDNGRQAEGRYTCTWARTPMPWRARIVWMDEVEPQVLR